MAALRSAALLLLASLALTAAAERMPSPTRATGRFIVAPWPYLPGSVVPLRIDGFASPFGTSILGPGRIAGGNVYEVPLGTRPQSALLVGGSATGLASVKLRIAAPPSLRRSLLVVASYDEGLVFHDAGTRAVLGVLATGGAPSDVALDTSGTIATADTDGATLTRATLSPWSVSKVDGVVLGDEIAIDPATRAIFVTDRDAEGGGALTRITSDGAVTRVTTGQTAEGIAIDARRHLVYVANSNDGTIAAVDARSMRLLRRFSAVSRIFSLAISPDGSLLYGISNESASSPFGRSGCAVALALQGGKPRIVARSADLGFPLGVALDAAQNSLYVTDEGANVVDVLDARTLRSKRAPLRTCTTPWKPTFDAAGSRLYVPCAQSDSIDVFDTRTLRRIAGAPFPTGSYPLSVAVWHPRRASR